MFRENRKTVSKIDRRQHRYSDFKSVRLELELVAGMLKSKEIMEVISKKFNSACLTSDRIRWIYDEAVRIYVYESELLDLRTFKHLLHVKANKKAIYLSLWRKIHKFIPGASMASSLACMDKLQKYNTARIIQIGIKNALPHLKKALEDGDLKAILDAKSGLVNMSDEIAREETSVVVTDPITDYTSYKREFKRIQKDPSSIMGLPTGIPGIDRQMLGLRNGEFALACADTGGGKSIFLMNVASNCWEFHGDVVAFTIEMSEQQYKSRWYSHISGIEYDRFRKFKLTKEEWNYLDKTVEKSKKHSNKFKIVDMPQGCSATNLRSELKSVMKDLKVRLVVIDYMNIMCGPSGEIDFSWPTQLSIAVELKLKVARAMNVPLWTVSQTQDGKSQAAFSSHIIDQLDVGGVIEMDENSAETGFRRWNWLKTRDFLGSPVTLETDFSRMRFTKLPDDIERNTSKFKKLAEKRINV